MAKLSYKDAGVDIAAGDKLVSKIKPYAKKTNRPEVLGNLGGFGALFELSNKYKNPVLVSGTDGVGTKLKLAIEHNKHETIGQDLVAMCVNDILVQGAEPLFFLDYFACGKLDVDNASTVIKGIAQGCSLAGCSLIGGESAEMPGMYQQNDYDLAGFCVGAVEKQNIINGQNIKANDVIIGLPSSGPHSNGYSLIRKIINDNNIDLQQKLEGKKLIDALMAPTKIYVKPILAVLQQDPAIIKGMAHITGGGLTDNIPRILPDTLCAQLNKTSWQQKAVFNWLNQYVTDEQMALTFNCGLGMVLVVEQKNAQQVMSTLQNNNQESLLIGQINNRDEKAVVLV